MVRAPGKDGLEADAKLFGQSLLRAPHVAAGFVNAPARLAALAEELRFEAVAAKSEARELTALRLHAAAGLRAMQMSRPVRTGNLIRARISAVAGAVYRLVWITEGRHAEITFPVGEIKNDRTVKMRIFADDAVIVWRWVTELRGRYMELRGIADSAYLLPGKAMPRLLKDDVSLPRGCASPSTIDEIRDDGAAHLGVACPRRIVEWARDSFRRSGAGPTLLDTGPEETRRCPDRCPIPTTRPPRRCPFRTSCRS